MFEVVYDKQDGSGFPVTIISFYAVRQIFFKKNLFYSSKGNASQRQNLTLNTIPAIVVPVFLAVGNLAPIFSKMAFLQNDQKLSINETSLQKH